MRSRIERAVRDLQQAKHNLRKRLKRLPEQSQRFQVAELTDVISSELRGGTKVVACSLYGNDPRYVSHLEEMLESFSAQLPSYTHRFYVAADVDTSVIELLRSNRCEIVTMAATGVKPRYMFWRFLACEDTQLERVLVRDVDHVALAAERAMVEKWEESGARFHIIRSHYSHNMRIMGGLWGAVPQQGLITRHYGKLWTFQNWLWGGDQVFLERYIYPSIRDSVFISELYQRFPDEEISLFPVNSTDFSFVGEPAFPRAARDASRADFKEQHSAFQAGSPVDQTNSTQKRWRGRK